MPRTKREPPELAGLNIESGISATTGEGFCLVAAVTSDGRAIAGQLDPEEVRQLALGWLSAAEAADHDAAVMAELIENVGLDLNQAAGFIAALRERRKE